MHYKFPVINHISDIEHAIDQELFIVAEREGHTIINYLFASPDVFPDISDNCDIAEIRREFRGIIFDANGNIIRRPLHKFFNVGERTDTQLNNIDVSKNHVIYDKLDGSMIAPYIVENKLIWGTKMGDTDVAKQAEEFVKQNDNYRVFAEGLIQEGFTPIFEWCSRQQRIVLDYPQDQLVLIAIRHIKEGWYATRTKMIELGFKYDIPVCKFIETLLCDDFLEDTKNENDVEGYVVRFDSGHMVKLKSEWYLALHRVKSDIEHERGVVRMIIEGGLDDLRPLMTDEDVKMIDEYEASFIKAHRYRVNDIINHLAVIEGERITRKDFAVNFAPKLPNHERILLFKLFDWGINIQREMVEEELNKLILAHCNRNVKFDELRKSEVFQGVIPYRPVVVSE